MSGPSHKLLSGWGRAAPSVATVVRPLSANEVGQYLRLGAPVLARGLGRAYADAAQCAGGTVVDCTGLDRILEFDHRTGTLRAEAGLSLDALMRTFVPRGFFVPVTPGTRYVTLGGAVASDIHGKNHHRDGAFSAHVRSMRIETPEGRRDCSPTGDAAGQDLFWATAGAMGLTGIVTEATVDLVPIETSLMKVDTERASDLDDVMSKMSESDATHRYSVAWIDSLARGKSLGRSVVTAGDHATLGDLSPKAREDPLGFAPRQVVAVPLTPPVSLLNPLTVAGFNEAWYRKAPKRRTGELQQISTFFHPLDGVGDWNLLYGPRGFTQYQFVVPFGSEEVVRTVLERLSSAKVASFLAVLKRFGSSGLGHLSFPAPGWTLALDLPLASKGLPELLDGLDELVAGAGGRVYLAKDGRIRPEVLWAMYPRLQEWSEVRARVDPGGTLTSDLGRRLGLLGPRTPTGASKGRHFDRPKDGR